MIAFKFTALADDHMQRNGYSPEEMLGAIPDFLSEDDAAGAVEQIDRAYHRFGGWRDTSGFVLDAKRGLLTYPGDQPRQLIAMASLRDEQIYFFNGAWLVVVQPDGSFRAARID